MPSGNLELLEEMGAQPIRGPRQHSAPAGHQKDWDVHYQTELRPREVYRPSRKLGSLTDSNVFWSERRVSYALSSCMQCRPTQCFGATLYCIFLLQPKHIIILLITLSFCREVT